jgi:hypothetical protein
MMKMELTVENEYAYVLATTWSPGHNNGKKKPSLLYYYKYRKGKENSKVPNKFTITSKTKRGSYKNLQFHGYISLISQNSMHDRQELATRSQPDCHRAKQVL